MVAYNNSANNLSRNQSVRSVTGSSATLTQTDNVVSVNFAGAVAITLPAPATTGATANVGKFYYIKDVSGAATTNNITVTPASGTIDGAANKIIAVNYGWLNVYCNGSNYFIQDAFLVSTSTAPPANSVSFRAAKTSDQSITSGSFVLVTFDTSIYDAGSNFSTGTSTFTAPNTAKYFFHCNLYYSAGSAVMGLLVNGSPRAQLSTTSANSIICSVLSLTAADAVTIQSTGSATTISPFSQNYICYFEGYQLTS